MSALKSHKELKVWQKSMLLVEHIYRLTEKFPKSELFGITNQMRRCSVSIPSCIAEGFGRQTSKDYAQFLTVAYGSALELETQLEISHRLKYISQEDSAIVNSLLEEVIRMLGAMKFKVKSLNTTYDNFYSRR